MKNKTNKDSFVTSDGTTLTPFSKATLSHVLLKPETGNLCILIPCSTFILQYVHSHIYNKIAYQLKVAITIGAMLWEQAQVQHIVTGPKTNDGTKLTITETLIWQCARQWIDAPQCRNKDEDNLYKYQHVTTFSDFCIELKMSSLHFTPFTQGDDCNHV